MFTAYKVYFPILLKARASRVPIAPAAGIPKKRLAIAVPYETATIAP